MEKEIERIDGQLVKSLAGSNFGDVMIVGGGISGIQAALDLATAGFKVYLVGDYRSTHAQEVRETPPVQARQTWMRLDHEQPL